MLTQVSNDSDVMGPGNLSSVLVVIVIMCSTTANSQSSGCNACNCQFNNVKVLQQLIESKMATALLNFGEEL